MPIYSGLRREVHRVESIDVSCVISGHIPSMPTIVYVHGLGSRADFFRPMIRRLPDFSHLAIDLPGHGESDRIASGYSLNCYMAIMHKILARLPIANSVMVGHSMGGWLSLMAAGDARSSIDGAVMFDTPMHYSNSAIPVSNLKDNWINFPRSLMAFSDNEGRFDATGGLLSWRNGNLKLTRQEICETISNLHKPLLALHGNPQLGGLVSDEDARKFGQNYPMVSFKAVPNAGHFIPIEDPESSSSLVREFANKCFKNKQQPETGRHYDNP